MKGLEHRNATEPDLSDAAKKFHEWKIENCAWNLGMITVKEKTPFSLGSGYDYPVFDHPGKGTSIYILDSGIKVKHASFDSPTGSRARNFKDAKDEDKSPYRDGNFVSRLIIFLLAS